jgi:hypothetical protein
MKRSRGSDYFGSSLSFLDMLVNINMMFFLFLFFALLQINPKMRKADIETKAIMMVVMTWPDNDPNDMDLWIKTPDGVHVGFTNTENSYLHYERDDRGSLNNFIMSHDDKTKTTLPVRREVIMFRGVQDGRFVVNVNLFSIKNMDGRTTGESELVTPLLVHVELDQLDPSYNILATKEISVTDFREEDTAFAFIVKDGKVIQIDKDADEKFITNADYGATVK